MTGYRLVQDQKGPYAGRWVVEDDSGRLVDGPFNDEADARHELDMRLRYERDAREVW